MAQCVHAAVPIAQGAAGIAEVVPAFPVVRYGIDDALIGLARNLEFAKILRCETAQPQQLETGIGGNELLGQHVERVLIPALLDQSGGEVVGNADVARPSEVRGLQMLGRAGEVAAL